MKGFDFNEGAFGMRVADADDNEHPFFDSGSSVVEDGLSRGYGSVVPGLLVASGGSPVFARPPFISRLNLTSPVFVSGIIAAITLLCALVVQLSAKNRDRRNQVLRDRLQLAAIVDSSPDAIIGIDLLGRVSSWNGGASKLLGFSAEETLGKTLNDLIVPDDRKNEEKEILAGIAEGRTLSGFESLRQTKGKGLVEVAISVSPVRGPNGEVEGAAKTLRDISERKHAEREIRALNADLETKVAQRTAELESARRALKTVLDAVPSMIGYWDRNLINRVANHAYHRWFGVAPESLPGKHIREVIGDALFEKNRLNIERALQGESCIFERVIPKSDGSGGIHSLTHYIPDVVNGSVEGFFVVVS